MSTNRAQFYSGTSNVVLPFTKSQFPTDFREKTRLEYYASLFNSVEINSVFYKLPGGKTIAKWAESVPADFRFTFKVSKSITHTKGLQFDVKDVHAFIQTVENCGAKKGCLLIQFPPSLKFEKYDRLQFLLETFHRAMRDSPWRVAVEFRDPSWYESETYELLAEHHATTVIQDMPKAPTPLSDIPADFVYLRFHGPEPRYRGDYSDAFLNQYAARIDNWMAEKKTVYAYFNNTVGSAFENLQTLNNLVDG